MLLKPLRAPLAILTAIAALAVAPVIAFELVHWDRVTPGVAALGRPLGGLTRGEARDLLKAPIAALMEQPLSLTYGDRHWDATASQLGLRLSADEVAERASQVGRIGSPIERALAQTRSLTTGTTVTFAPNADTSVLDAWLTSTAAEIDQPVRDADVRLDQEGRVVSQSAQVGKSLDPEGSRRVVLAVLQGQANQTATIPLVVRETSPAVVDTQVQPAVDRLQRLLGGVTRAPLLLSFEDQKWGLDSASVASMLTITPPRVPGAPFDVRLDESQLETYARDTLARQVNQEVQDARFQWERPGKLRVLRESQEGHELDEAATVRLIRDALESGDRGAPRQLPVRVQGSAVPSDNPAKLGIVDLIDRGSTSFAGSQPEKVHNIRLAAERLNGAVVPPGGTFSFNDSVGPTTLEAGFTWGFGITAEEGEARTVPSVAGGICQVATTLFQPVFWAGFPLEERYWHLYWIPAYTSRGVVGLDVTVDADARLDFRWLNPTPNHVLVQSWVEGDAIHFALYGKKPEWTVSVEPARIHEKVAPDPTPQIQEEPTLPRGRTIQVETAREGFQAEVTRRVIPRQRDQEARTLTLRSTYQPSRTVTLVGTGGQEPGEAPPEPLTAAPPAQQ